MISVAVRGSDAHSVASPRYRRMRIEYIHNAQTMRSNMSYLLVSASVERQWQGELVRPAHTVALRLLRPCRPCTILGKPLYEQVEMEGASTS